MLCFIGIAEVTNLKNSHRAHRFHADRLMKSIHDLLENINLEDEFEVSELKAFKENHEHQFSKIQTLDDDIIPHLEEDPVEEELLKSLQEKGIFYTVLKKVELCLNKVVMETASSHTHRRCLLPLRQLKSDLKVKSPKIELSKFSGQALKWLTSWDQFGSAIHSKESVSGIDRFMYLKGLLTGSASDCISGLSLTDPNYKEAVNILKGRYANPQVIISTHIESFLKLPVIRDLNNVASLRNIYDRTDSIFEI